MKIKQLTKGSKDSAEHLQEGDLDKFNLGEKFSEFSGWEAVGFHRPLAGELWEVILELFNIGFMIFLIVYLTPIINPYPVIGGYRSLANGIFVLVFVIFDTGTNFGLGRFIAEYRIKDPQKMMEYVNFFIRYQMITGLIQVTALTYYILEVVIHGNYAYLVWIILLEMQKQYPGMLGIFKSVLSGMQHLSIVKAFDWIQGKAIEMIFNIGFILWGRAYGQAHPEIGILMGIAIFGTIGVYIDDIIMMFVSAWYLNKIMKKNIGYSLRESLSFKIGKDVKQNAIRYGIPGSILPIISSAVNTYILLAYSDNIAGYTSWVALVAVGSNIAGTVDNWRGLGLATNVAEAYMNDKRHLAQFYVAYEFRWRYFLRIMLGMTVIAVLPIFYLEVQYNPEIRWWEPGFFFIIPALIRKMLDPLFGSVDGIMTGAKKINQYQIIRAVEELLKFVSVYLYIYVWEIQDKWGIYSIVFLILFQNYIPYLIKTLLCFIYVQRNIMRMKVYWMSTMVIPVISCLPIFGFSKFWFELVMPGLIEALTFNIALVVSAFCLFIILIFSYFPLTVLLGGWDDYQLFTFREAVKLSGPSKIIFGPVLKLMIKIADFGRKKGVHGRFPIPYKEAHQEIIELMELKQKTKIKLQQSNK
ncbi:MAG: hypothetical protein ACTSRK_18830 [Promethearchaeota archaeon]